MNRDERFRAANPYRVWGYRPNGTRVLLRYKNAQEADADIRRRRGSNFTFKKVGTVQPRRVVKRRVMRPRGFVPFGGL